MKESTTLCVFLFQTISPAVQTTDLKPGAHFDVGDEIFRCERDRQHIRFILEIAFSCHSLGITNKWSMLLLLDDQVFLLLSHMGGRRLFIVYLYNKRQCWKLLTAC